MVNVESRTRKRIVTFYILASVHQIGGHQRKRKMEDLEREKELELGEMTEVRQEVVIEGERNPKIVVGDNNPHTNLETEFRE